MKWKDVDYQNWESRKRILAMKKCEPWAVAAVYLMQSASGKEHYTKIVNYILETELTELIEQDVATSHTVTQMLNQKVVNGRAVFNNDGNGYYSLNNEGVMRKNEDIQGVIQSLKSNNQEVNLITHEAKQSKPVKEDQKPESDDDRLSDEARRLSDEARKLSDETRKLSDETIKLSDENKKLREETKGLCEENQQLKDKLQSIRQLCEQV